MKYDSTYNFVGDKYEFLEGQTLLVSSDQKFSSGFFNLFWSNKKGKIYKKIGNKTPYQAVANRKFFVEQVVLGGVNPLLLVVDSDNNEKLYINYTCNNPNYYPFIIEGYLAWRFAFYVGYNYFIELSKTPKISMYAQDNLINDTVLSKFSQWYCKDYYYDDSYDLHKERLVLNNAIGSSLDIPISEVDNYFIRDFDDSFIKVQQQRLDSIRVLERLEMERNAQLKDSMLVYFKQMYEGQKYYIKYGFEINFGVYKEDDLVTVDEIKLNHGLYFVDIVFILSNDGIKHEVTLPVSVDNNLITGSTKYSLPDFYSYFSSKKNTFSSKNTVKLGMTDKEVMQLWGKPVRINRTMNKYVTREQWVYPDYVYLYFENGVLTTIQDRR